MIWLVFNLLLFNSYHIDYDYTPKDYEVVKQMSLLAIDKLDYSWCSKADNYYADEKYFAFETLCDVSYWLHKTQIRYITVVDIKAMTFHRFNETQL